MKNSDPKRLSDESNDGPISQRMIVLSPLAEEDNGEPKNTYLWGYQQHFAVAMLTESQRVFRRIHPDLLSDVFLVAVRIEGEEHLPPAVVEPPDHPMRASDFQNVVQATRDGENTNPGPMFAHHSDDKRGQYWVQAQQSRHFRDGLRQEIRGRVANAFQTDHVHPFVSQGRSFRGYAIYTVLLVNSRVRDELAQLKKETSGEYSVCTSFVDAVVQQVCQEAWAALALSLDGEGYPSLPRTEAIFRAAADSFMHTPMAAAKNMNGLHNGFDSCNEISALTYEKAVGYSRLLIAKRNHPNVELLVTFENPISLRNYRGVRKVLELAGAEEWLVCDSEKIVGLGRFVGSYDPSHEDIFTIDFIGHAKWELRHTGVTLMRVEHGIPSVPRPSEQITQMVDTLERVFPDLDDRYLNAFRRIATEFVSLKHGLVMIVSDDAEAEASRFQTESTRIEPIPLTVDLLQRASRIDGAILVSPEAVCYSIGVILDGEVNRRGSSERGARFNSTVRYVHSRNAKCFGVVASDDGTIDFVPNFRPRLNRSNLKNKLEQLEQIVEAAEFSERQFRDLCRWFENHAFYFDKVTCRRVNELLTKGDKLKSQTGFQLIRQDFEPHADFDETYLV